MEFSKMELQRKIILIAGVIGAISVFLPWYTISVMGMAQSTNGFRGAGIIVFLAFAASTVISILGDQKLKLDKKLWLSALIIGCIAFLFILISFGSSESDPIGFVESGYGIGIWLALICSIGILFAAWFLKEAGLTLKSTIDSMRITPAAAGITELERLVELKNQGKITEEEYQRMKSKIV